MYVQNSDPGKTVKLLAQTDDHVVIFEDDAGHQHSAASHVFFGAHREATRDEVNAWEAANPSTASDAINDQAARLEAAAERNEAALNSMRELTDRAEAAAIAAAASAETAAISQEGARQAAIDAKAPAKNK